MKRFLCSTTIGIALSVCTSTGMAGDDRDVTDMDTSTTTTTSTSTSTTTTTTSTDTVPTTGLTDTSKEPSGGYPLDPSATPVGTIEGRFDVTPGGSAAYSVPIIVPPGTRGIEPRLSLAYNSHGDNTSVGVGFDLGGLSSIQRCPPTLAQDGYIDGIDLDAGDRFCLDGLRLVLVEGKGYGKIDSVYHTEGETGSRIEANGQCGDGPCYFTMTRKDGVEIQFGSEGSMACNVVGGTGNGELANTRVSWPMTRLTDLHGNSLTITYDAIGEHRCGPVRIDYTGNTVTGQQPLRAVTFEYEDRPDVERHYTAGRLFTLEQRLAYVRTWIHPADDPSIDQAVLSYRLRYETGSHTFRSRLIELTECGASGACLPPTHFTWSDGDWMTQTEYVLDPGSTYFEPAPSDRQYVGDFDGSGRADFLTFFDDADPDDPEMWSEELTERADSITPLFDADYWLTANMDPALGERMHVGDVNGDGANDLLILGATDENGWGGWRVYPGGPGGLNHNYQYSGSEPSLEDTLIFADFSGDGRSDALAFDNPGNRHSPWYYGWRLYIWDGDGFQLASDGSFSEPGTQPGDVGYDDLYNWDPSTPITPQYYPGDFNGDGRIDLFGTRRIYLDQDTGWGSSYTEWKLFVSNGAGFDLTSTGAWPEERYNVVPADYNGDGLTDLIVTDDDSWQQTPGYILFLSDGVDLEPQFNILSPQQVKLKEQGEYDDPITLDWGYTGEYPNGWYRLYPVNLNDDGKADILAVINPELKLEDMYEPPPADLVDQVKLLVSDGTQLIEVSSLNNLFGTKFLLGDFYGHGMTSMLRRVNIDVVFNYTSSEDKPDLLTGIVDGVSAGTYLQYLPMTYGYVYEKGSGASYPERDFRVSRYLVRAIDRSDGAGNLYHSWYRYEGARTDLTGRGFLGFSRVQVDNDYDGSRLVTEYRQDFPFAGALSAQERWSGNTLLSRTDYEYIDKPWPNAPGTFQVLKSAEETQLFDANGIVINTALRDMTYDDYGNLKQLTDVAALNDPASTLVTTTTYHNDTAAWRFGYPEITTTYDDNGVLLSQKKQSYDKDMNVEFEGSWDDVHGTWIGTTQTFDDFGNPETSTDPSGNESTFTWDHYQFLHTATNPKLQTITREYDPRFGEEHVRTDENGHTTTLSLDDFGRTTSISGPDAQGNPVVLQKFSYATVGYGMVAQSFVRRDWAGDEWDWKETYKDALGREYLTRKRGEGETAIVVAREFSGLDLVSRATRPHFEGSAEQWITYSYDARRRPTLVLLPDNGTFETQYDDVNNTVTRIDPNNATSTQVLNGRGRRIAMIDPLGKTSTFTYDPLGRVTQAVDPLGNTTTTSWDSLGRRRSVTDSQAGLSTFTYDVEGHLTGEQDAKGQRIERDYDALDRTTVKRYYPAGAQTPTREVQFTYDDQTLANTVGRLSRVQILENGTLESAYTFAYDAYGHQVAATLELGDRVFAWSESFDPSGVGESMTYPDGSEMRLDHTAGGNLEKVSLYDAIDPGAGFVDHAIYSSFDAEGRPAQLRYANDVVSCYEYDAYRGLLTHARVARFGEPGEGTCSGKVDPLETLLDNVYKWDEVNNLTDLEDLLDADRTQSFTYNLRGELLTAQGIYGNESYDYDEAGNRTWRDGVQFTYQGQQVVSSTAGMSATWDANGNLETKSDVDHAWEYHWDVEDNLKEVVRDGESTTYLYDFNGHRIYKRDPDGRETFYVANLYEVTVGPDKVELHTKYVPGPAGNLVQISHKDVQLAALVQSNTYEQMAAMFGPTTIVGRLLPVALYGLAYVSGPEFSRQAMTGVLALIGMLAAAGALVTLHRCRRVGAKGARGHTTRLMRRSPRRAMALPFTLAMLLAGQVLTPQVAVALQPGANGAGVPVEGTYYFHQNHIRSSVLLTDASGKLSTRLEYLPWGQVYADASKGDDISRAKFNGKEWDAGADVYAFNERYYDPGLGRFIQADRSIGADPMKTVSLNRYAYAANNPATYVDPSGRFAIAAFLVVVALVAIAGALVLGTDGKILSDPSHAFDNWSWSRAFFGFLIGMFVGVVSFGLGTIGVGVALMGVSLNTVLVSTFVGGVLTLTMAYASGERDGGKLLAYFGIGLLAGFISGTGGLGAAGAAGQAGKLFSDLATSVATSMLKKLVDPNNAIGITLWALTLTIDRFNSVSFDLNYGYLAGAVVDMGLANGVELEAPEFDPMTGEKWSGHVENVGALRWVRETFLAKDWQARPDQAAFNLVGLVGRKVLSFALHQWIEHSGFRTSMWDPARKLLEGDLGYEAIGGKLMELSDGAWAADH